jgi:hypothetical protein
MTFNAVPCAFFAGRLPKEAADRARARVRKATRRKGRTPDKRTLLAAGFCLLVTSLPAEQWPAEELLALYRVRWQVEWCIRLWKNLCELKRLPAYQAPIAAEVLKAKLVLILLLQQRSFSDRFALAWVSMRDRAPRRSPEMAIGEPTTLSPPPVFLPTQKAGSMGGSSAPLVPPSRAGDCPQCRLS